MVYFGRTFMKSRSFETQGFFFKKIYIYILRISGITQFYCISSWATLQNIFTFLFFYYFGFIENETLHHC